MTWPSKFWVVGTDTDVGKTIVSAALCSALNYNYFKPIQSGSRTDSDKKTVMDLIGLSGHKIVDEIYRLTEPLSPHRAAEIDAVTIDVNLVQERIDQAPSNTLIEAAGGLLVPITRKTMQIELIANSKFPVVLVTRTTLGTINHTLLSVLAIKKYGIPLFAVVFNGEKNEDNIRTITDNLDSDCLTFHFPKQDLSSMNDFVEKSKQIFNR